MRHHCDRRGEAKPPRMVRARYLSGLLFLFLASYCAAEAQGPLSPGEMLRYKVRWSFIRLGTVEITQAPLDPADPNRRQFMLAVKSADGVPFVDLDLMQTATAAIDSLDLARLTVEARHGEPKKTTYLIERSAGRLVVIDSSQTGLARADTVSLAEKCYDALSLLLLARMRCSQPDTISIRTLVNGDLGETILEFAGRTETIEVPAFDDGVEAFRFTGDARWVGTGFAGMNGKFNGWISRDEAAVPLRAEVGIFLGSIVLELESIERPSWESADTAVSAMVKAR